MIKIITTCYNCEKFIEECILSVLLQEYSEWEMYIFDDYSTDNSIQVAENTINGDPRIKIIKNSKNMGAVYNKTFSFVKNCSPDDEDIIVTLDGDDFFIHKQALSYLNSLYLNGWWMTYGGASHGNNIKFPDDFYTEVDWSKSLRKQRFCLGHLRSHKFFLMKNIKDIDLRYKDGALFKVPEDVILFLPMVEMCGEEKAHHFRQSFYFYRWHDNCDGLRPEIDSHRDDIMRLDLSIRKPYPRKTKEELINWECDWTYKLKNDIIIRWKQK
tara:strand:- start:3050 stop:3859 length:810 start_codon:yes stop_codon:yes gene_type:complete